MTHTPGPWTDAPDHKGTGVYTCPNGLPEGHIANVNTGPVAWQANARLIAAAPAMLEALKGVIEEEQRRNRIGTSADVGVRALANTARAIIQAIEEGD